ncbi:MAG: CYTH domain-containing protein [Flavobacteriaceae bacterium]|nr:CYTH domain-containing protein [Flavobacteriaceae bacterium]
MAQEIERKFLVKGAYKSLATSNVRISQGYLSSVAVRTVRVRISDNTGFLTIKGIGNASGTTRYEWEREIPLQEAKELLLLCEKGVIEKTRFLIPEASGLTFEVDEFYGENQGLVVAEIELPSEAYSFEKPDWLGEEVTGDTKYYNACLMSHPFEKWGD